MDFDEIVQALPTTDVTYRPTASAQLAALEKWLEEGPMCTVIGKCAQSGGHAIDMATVSAFLEANKPRPGLPDQAVLYGLAGYHHPNAWRFQDTGVMINFGDFVDAFTAEAERIGLPDSIQVVRSLL